jgi:hypothetical protein
MRKYVHCLRAHFFLIPFVQLCFMVAKIICTCIMHWKSEHVLWTHCITPVSHDGDKVSDTLELYSISPRLIPTRRFQCCDNFGFIYSQLIGCWISLCIWHNITNPLKPSGHYMYHLLWHTKILHSAHRVYLCVSYGSHNKQRLFPQTALTGWAL